MIVAEDYRMQAAILLFLFLLGGHQLSAASSIYRWCPDKLKRVEIVRRDFSPPRFSTLLWVDANGQVVGASGDPIDPESYGVSINDPEAEHQHIKLFVTDGSNTASTTILDVANSILRSKDGRRPVTLYIATNMLRESYSSSNRP